jgi:hypothetical protein
VEEPHPENSEVAAMAAVPCNRRRRVNFERPCIESIIN